MAIYHCTMNIVGRSSKRHVRSAVAASAYRSGSRMINEWDGVVHDYRKKSYVAYSEVMLPDNAPEEFRDRSILWNSVELSERRGNAQLCRDIEVSLPVELSHEEHIKIVREYCEQFRSAGMCVDLNIHDKPGNPHCHILLTLKPLDEKGNWLPRSRMVYDLDENGQRIRLPSGRWKNHKENTVDWNEHSKADEWRASWADVVNRHLEANGRSERIDHRSNQARGIFEIPSIHMGPAACAMEAKGIRTERGDINRSIKAANRLIREIREKLADLKSWLAAFSEAVKETFAENSSPSIGYLMEKYLDKDLERLQKYKAKGFKYHMENRVDVQATVNKLAAENIYTLEDLDTALADIQEKSYGTRQTMIKQEKRMQLLQKNIEMAQQFQKTLPVRDSLNKIKFKKAREKFEEENRADLALWNVANRYFHAKKIDATSLEESVQQWQTELASLSVTHEKELAVLRAQKEKLKELGEVRRQIDSVLPKEPRAEQAKDQGKTL